MAMLQLHNLNLAKGRRVDQTWRFFQELGLIEGNTLYKRNYAGVNGAWAGQPAYVVGASPSLRQPLAALGGWAFFRGKHTIGINHLIEDWDGFEWHLFLDRRFVDITTYDLGRFRGMFFARCTTGLQPEENRKIFFTRSDKVSDRIEDGLYGKLSGIAAVNLALISGANPIYLLGLEPGAAPVSNDNLHYKRGYTGEKPRERVVEKYAKIMSWFDIFQPVASRLRLVTDGGNWFPWMRRQDVAGLAPAVKVEPREAKVVHLSFSPHVQDHADFTREVVTRGAGRHSLVDVNHYPVPDADLYVAEHFLSTNAKINALTPAQKAKTINVVHTVDCVPSGAFARVVALTHAWRRWLEGHQVKVTDVVVPGIGLGPYARQRPAGVKVFGRLTRWRPGKVHPQWNPATLEILNGVPGSSCVIFTEKNEDPARDFMKDPRVTYRHDVKIDSYKGQYLGDLSVYVHANGSFKETFSFACVEAMATGLPVVYLSEGTGVLEEVVGDGGVSCQTMGDVVAVVTDLLQRPARAQELGAQAQARAFRLYDVGRAAREFDKVVETCLTR